MDKDEELARCFAHVRQRTLDYWPPVLERTTTVPCRLTVENHYGGGETSRTTFEGPTVVLVVQALKLLNVY